MITTVLFDMDGLLLDTEPLWGISMRQVADANGIRIAPERFSETTGLRIHEVCEHWSRHYPWEGKSHPEIADAILDDIILRSQVDGRVMPGVLPLLDALDARGARIGLASSSPARMIEALVTHFGIRDRFQCITSADAVAYGKPHPAVFLHCAESLGAAPHECVVLEDSVNGCIAGKAARMRVIAVPAAENWNDPRFAIADQKVRSLQEMDAADLLRA